MGVHGLWQLLQPAGKPIALESLEGKILAVDVSIWLNKAAKGMRDKFGNPVYNAHLIVIFQRLCKLLFYKVKPIFVFDGGVPELKKKTIAARRERKFTAEAKELRARRKIFQNYLKGKVLETVTGQKGPRIKNPITRKEGQDLFELPPLAASNQAESSSDGEGDLDEEAEWMAGMRSDRVERMFEEIGSVDIDADEFISLPSEIQHEVLMEMKDSYRRRYNRRKTQEMPEEAHNFSDFQLKNLFRRGKITKKIDDIRKEMKTKSSGHIAELEEENALRKRIETFEANRIASEDKHHYILLKKEEKKGENVLFNSKLEVNALEIYEGVRRNENFDRLEREPLQFNSLSVDQPNIITFMSDSTEDSDFDEEFSPSDARKFTTSQGENTKVENIRVENVIGQRTALITSDFSSKLADEDGGEFRKSEDLASSGSENSPELEDFNITKEEDLFNDKVDEKPLEDSGTNMSSSNMEVDAFPEVKYPNSSIQNSATSESHMENDTPQTLDLTGDKITETPRRRNTLDVVSDTEVPSGFRRVGDAISRDSAVAAKDKEGHTEGRISRVVDELSSAATESGVLSGKSQYDNESSASPLEILATDDEDVSAVPKPDIRGVEDSLQSEVVHEADNGDLKEFKSAVKDCKSAEELSSLREALASEQSKLHKERERQSRAAASVQSDEYDDVQELLRLFGIPFIISPMEAEAQCAVLDLSNQTHGSITDDSDILLFGGRRIYKNVFNQDKYAELYTIENINHTLYDRALRTSIHRPNDTAISPSVLYAISQSMKTISKGRLQRGGTIDFLQILDREKMIALAYLTGSDYTEGIQGVGVITAMEILQEFGGGSMQALVNLQNWFEKVKGKSDLTIFEEESKLKSKLRLLDLPRTFPNHKVWEAYLNPPADYSDEPFEWGKPDLDAIREFARHKFGWRSSRTDEVILPMMKRFNSNQNQTTLNRYFTDTFDATKRTVASKRLQRTVNLMRSGITGTTNYDTCTPPNEKKQRLKTPSHVADATTVGSISNDTLRSMSYRNRRMPSNQDFKRRVAKSRASSRSRGKRFTQHPLTSTNQEPNRNRIISRKVELSDSSSDSDA